MTEREVRPREVPRKHRRLYERGAFFIVVTALIIALFTSSIVYGMQSLVGGEAVEGVLVDGVREFEIQQRQWSSEPAVIKLNPGDKVRFIVTSRDLGHGFAINELGINLALSPEGTAVREVVVPPDIAEGVYTMYCSVFCGIGHPYMKGTVIIGNPELFLGVGLGRILPYVATLIMAVMFAAIIVIGERRATANEGRRFHFDLMKIGIIRRLVRLHPFQFLILLPVLAVFVLASISIIFGVRHPGFNFGMVLTWVVWWGLLIGLFVVVGRGWCLICPFGALGEWLQRLSLWWKRKWSLGFNFRYPRRLQNLWLAIVFFVGFIFLDAGYGISNSPALTSGLLVTVILWAMWIGLFFERRTFCRYQCPITVFIGMSSMFAPFEIRRKDAEVCRQCQTKDCFRGNEQFYGCPVFEFPGGGMDNNRDCLLCTECIKACPYENITMRLRGWGRDLWARKRGKLDESVAAVILASLVTVVSFLLFFFLSKTYILMSTVLPAGAPPNDWPRVVSIGLIYLGGIATSLLLMYGFSYLSKLFSGAKDITTKTFFIHFGYAVIPLGIMKFLADILDHVFRTWGAVVDVSRALVQDFPLNRLMLKEVTVEQLMSAHQTYLLQMVMIGIGLGFSLYVAHKLAGRMFPEGAIAFRAFLPIGAFIFILGMTALWTLSVAL